MNSERQITQCLSCGKVKQDDDTWCEKDISPFEKNISHTYCKRCIRVLQEKLMAAREFRHWPFDEQVRFLRSELDRQPGRHDRRSFKNYLEEFFCVHENEFEKLYEETKDRLAASICPCCRQEISQQDSITILGSFQLHRKCYRETAQKIKIILDNNWQKSDKLDAYFDLLRIEKELRLPVRELILQQDGKIGTTA